MRGWLEENMRTPEAARGFICRAGIIVGCLGFAMVAYGLAMAWASRL